MKRVIKFSFSAAIGAVFLLYSCGGDSSSSSSSAQQEPVGSSEATTEVVAVTDPEARSDSKGVGKFTSVEIGPLDKGMAEKGKIVFENKCASCHKTSEEKIVGPGVKGITQRRTPEWIMNMITNPQEMTQKDPVAKALLEKHLIQMTFQNVSDEEARELLEFFRQNDI